MLKALQLGLIFLFTLALVGCDADLPTILEKDPGFTFELPSGWKSDPGKLNKEMQSTWSHKSGDGRMTITVTSLNEQQMRAVEDLKSYGEKYLEILKDDPNYENLVVSSHGPVKVAGAEGYEYVFSASRKRSLWRRTLFVKFPNNKERVVKIAFAAALGKESSFEGSFAAILDSWVWKDQKVESK